jgi:hypothetical protein
MLTPARFPQVSDGTTPAQLQLPRARDDVRVRALIAAALLAIGIGVLLSWLMAGARPAVAPPVPHRGFSSLPLTAQGPISAALGADLAGYRVTRTTHGLTAFSPGQRVHAQFSRSGVVVDSHGGEVGMRLGAVGYGERRTSVAAVAPTATANRVNYAHPGITEWYANGPLGLEQGFTVLRPPAGRQTGPLTLSIAISGAARAPLAPDAQSVLLGHGLRYGGLGATDARGRMLPSKLAVRGGLLLLSVDIRSARYPLRIDPFIQKGEKVTGAEESGKAEFGLSIAISADGSTALVGGPEEGAAWVFTRSGSTWTQQGPKLTGNHAAGSFGASVALSGDGDTALIFEGGSTGPYEGGTVAVFVRSGSTWTRQANLTGQGVGYFGGSLSLSADGNTALIGSYADGGSPGPKWVGSAWVFTRSGSTWTQPGVKLTGAGEIGEGQFGWSVALSADGDTAVIGGPADNPVGGVGRGATWIFTRSGSAWTQQGEELTGAGEEGEGRFGSAVAVAADGNTAVVGAPLDDAGHGALWVFTRSGSTWTQQGERLTATGAIGETQLGSNVALSGDGSTALSGSRLNNAGVGAVWVFGRSDSTWTQHGEFVAEDEVGPGEFGFSVALSADAGTALVGGRSDNKGTGAFWSFMNEPVGPPAIVTGAASAITIHSATLNAMVNPNGQPVSDCHFEYGTTASYGSSVPCTSLPGSGEAPVSVAQQVAQLTEDTTYHFRAVATNPSGTEYGSDERFTTLPNPPEFGRCIKVNTWAGLLANATCTKSGGTQTYEWYPQGGTNPLAKTGFTTTLKQLTTVILYTAGKHVLTCTGETGSGRYSGPKTVANVSIRLTGCHLGATEACQSSEAAEGEIVTSTLGGELGIVQASTGGAVKNLIGMDLAPTAGEVLAVFACGATPVVITGSVIAKVTAKNAMKLQNTLIFAATARGIQNPTRFEGGQEEVLHAKFGAGGISEAAGLKLTLIQTNEEKVEVNSVF